MNLSAWSFVFSGIVVVLLLLFDPTMFSMSRASSPPVAVGPAETDVTRVISYDDFYAKLSGGLVTDVDVQGSTVVGHFDDGSAFSADAPEPPDADALRRLTVQARAGQ